MDWLDWTAHAAPTPLWLTVSASTPLEQVPEFLTQGVEDLGK